MPAIAIDRDLQEEDDAYKEKTQDRVENILNLGYAQFEPAENSKYDIPAILPTYELPEVEEWIGFNYAKSEPNPENKGVHFFVDDYQFERVWNDPVKYVKILSEFKCLLAPDFSPYGDMPLIAQMWNHYRKHWISRYWQLNGLVVIPTVRSSTDKRSLDWFLEGEPANAIIAYSSMWTTDNTENKDYEINVIEYEQMIKELKPTRILLYGELREYMKKEKSIITKIEIFTESRWG